MSVSKRDFSVIVATNERFVSPVTTFLREQNYNIREEHLESGDIFIALPPSEKRPEEQIAACIEVKSIPNLKGDLKGNHAHIRGQINSFHRSEYPVYFKKVLVIGDISELDESETKAMISLSLGCELEHPQRVTWSNISYLEELPYFIDKMVELILLYEETPRKLPTLEKLNISLKRMHPDKPSDFVQLQMMEVRGIGETKAELIASNFDSLDHLISVAKNEGELFLTKKFNRPYLGDILSRKAYASLGLELQPAKEKQPRKRKQQQHMEDWAHYGGDDDDGAAVQETPEPKKKKKKVTESPTKISRSRSTTPDLLPYEACTDGDGDDDGFLVEEEEEIVMVAPRKKKQKTTE